MHYRDEWLKTEATDEMDEFYHRSLETEYQFYRAVAAGDVETVRKDCWLGSRREEGGVGVLSR